MCTDLEAFHIPQIIFGTISIQLFKKLQVIVLKPNYLAACANN